MCQSRLLYACTVPTREHSHFITTCGYVMCCSLSPLPLLKGVNRESINEILGSKAAAEQRCIFITGHHLEMAAKWEAVSQGAFKTPTQQFTKLLS